MKSLGEEAIDLINYMINEEESDVECKLIEKGTLKEKNIHYRENDEDITWKLRRIQVLKFILKRIKGEE